jgi:heat-inducible transcriptional repressor
MMAHTVPQALDQRKAAVLRAVVRDYVKTAQPVGSKTLAERHRMKVSSATVRNDMAVLEELGYVSQPHTSAGRIPTDLGYRWFIDNWPEPVWPELSERKRSAIGEFAHAEFPTIDDALEGTSQVLSEVTEATAVVVAPASKRIFRGGTANILSPDKFSDMATAHEIVEALEQPPVVSSLVEAIRGADTILVFVGSEVPVKQMRSCAVIFASYRAGEASSGALGVVGPTRMDYPHTISAVQAVAQSVSSILESFGR